MASNPSLLTLTTLTLAMLLAPLLASGSWLHPEISSPFPIRNSASEVSPPPSPHPPPPPSPPPPPPPPPPPRSPPPPPPSPSPSLPPPPSPSRHYPPPPPPPPPLSPPPPPPPRIPPAAVMAAPPGHRPSRNHTYPWRSPPPPLRSPPPQTTSNGSFLTQPTDYTPQPPSPRKDTKTNAGWTVGMAFLGVGVFLQVALGAFLVYKKRQLQRIDRASDGIPTSSSSPALLSS